METPKSMKSIPSDENINSIIRPRISNESNSRGISHDFGHTLLPLNMQSDLPYPTWLIRLNIHLAGASTPLNKHVIDGVVQDTNFSRLSILSNVHNDLLLGLYEKPTAPEMIDELNEIFLKRSSKTKCCC